MGLAGPKNKQRISVDPQNKAWAEDKSKLGYKMLKSLGWSEGKGLGKHEDGNTSHVKVQTKQNTWGIGADKKTVENWLDNALGFESLLSNLNESVAAVDESKKSPDESESEVEVNVEKKVKVVKKEKKSSKKEKKDKNDMSKKEKKRKADDDGDSDSDKRKKKSKKSKKHDSEDEKSEEDEETPAVATTTSRDEMVMSGRYLHRRKYLKNKNVSAFSEEALNKILGIKPSSTSSSPWADATVDTTETTTTTTDPAHHTKTTTTIIHSHLHLEKAVNHLPPLTHEPPLITKRVGIQDYFAQKMSALMKSTGRPLLLGKGIMGNQNQSSDWGSCGGGIGYDREERWNDDKDEEVEKPVGGIGFGDMPKVVEVEDVDVDLDTTVTKVETLDGVSDGEVASPKTKSKKDKKEKKEKKEKKKKEDFAAVSSPASSEPDTTPQEEEVNKKEQKKKRKTDADEDSTTPSKKKKKSKKSKSEEEPEEASEKKSKKDKKLEKKESPLLTPEASSEDEKNAVEVKAEKKVKIGKAKRDKWGKKIEQ
ncbi:hypothetical protein HDV05_006126 [Chytridiales sp. JEL 0842]|nr:hypothetical protein HDV05_006126 [Chytridiales sp. JEL 0842]